MMRYKIFKFEYTVTIVTTIVVTLNLERKVVMTTYASVVYNNGRFVPVNLLDNILIFKGNALNCRLHSFLTGEAISDENASSVYLEVISNTKNKIYPTTDHMFISAECNNKNICYVSL